MPTSRGTAPTPRRWTGAPSAPGSRRRRCRNCAASGWPPTASATAACCPPGRVTWTCWPPSRGEDWPGSGPRARPCAAPVPPSVWGRIAFEPPLPTGLTPQMGRTVKFLVGVKKRFWKDLKLSPESLTDGPIHLTWEATDRQPGEEGACLTLCAGGPSVDRILRWPPERRAAELLAALGKLYSDVAKQVERTRLMDWPNDPWVRAGYSFPAPGEVTTVGPLLHKGLGRLHFAGEHTCYAFFGYMEGALHSGVSLARKWAKRDGVLK